MARLKKPVVEENGRRGEEYRKRDRKVQTTSRLDFVRQKDVVSAAGTTHFVIADEPGGVGSESCPAHLQTRLGRVCRNSSLL